MKLLYLDNGFCGSMISQSAAPIRYIPAATKNAAWKEPNIRSSSAADSGASIPERLEARLTKPDAVPPNRPPASVVVAHSTGSVRSEAVLGLRVSPDYFQYLRQKLEAGRVKTVGVAPPPHDA